MKTQVKKILLLIFITVVALVISTTISVKKETERIQKEFVDNMLSCTPAQTNDQKVIIHGKTQNGDQNGEYCHISYPGKVSTETKNGVPIKLDNCYFPIKDGRVEIDFKYCR